MVVIVIVALLVMAAEKIFHLGPSFRIQGDSLSLSLSLSLCACVRMFAAAIL